MPRAFLAVVFAALAAVAAVVLTASNASVGPIAGFSLVKAGPDGGSAWQGVIPGTSGGESIVYLPPGYSTTTRRYPVVYVLHGLPGSPYSVVDGMRFAGIADRLIAAARVRAFVAVIPAGPPPRYDGEWAGVWERHVIDDVLPWSESHLAVAEDAAGRILAGYSAGGFGAVDIGLRHPGTFGTLESWSGYFAPPHDGPFRRASAAALEAHDPTLLVRRSAADLRRPPVRLYLSVGSTHDRWTEKRTRAFARELRALRLSFRLWLAPGGHNGRFWRRQLPSALEFALPGRLQEV